ncbi:MAG: polyprenyl synthetase family protein, partial [Fluviicola sp.]
MKELHQYTQFLEQKVNTFSFPNEPKNLYDPLRYFLTIGGKRMRPILTLMSANLFDVSKEEAYSAAMSIELFHNFSLIHDDIMDMAPVRRGKETVHEKWNSTSAILSGDVLLVKAYEQLAHYT